MRDQTCTCHWNEVGIKGAHHEAGCPVVELMPPCPSCAGQVPVEMTGWLFRGRFYCSEGCARKAMAKSV